MVRADLLGRLKVGLKHLIGPKAHSKQWRESLQRMAWFRLSLFLSISSRTPLTGKKQSFSSMLWLMSTPQEGDCGRHGIWGWLSLPIQKRNAYQALFLCAEFMAMKLELFSFLSISLKNREIRKLVDFPYDYILFSQQLSLYFPTLL